jgi:hypothetical protein
VKKLHTNRNKQRQKQLIADVVALKKSAADQVFVFFGEAKRRYQCFLVNLFSEQLKAPICSLPMFLSKQF